MQVDHIVPVAHGGSSDESNLWLACATCNQHKWAKIEGIDPVSQSEVPIFNPRDDAWKDHFAWDENGLYIIGLTPTGRATVSALNMNNALIIQSRFIWIESGLHPPEN